MSEQNQDLQDNERRAFTLLGDAVLADAAALMVLEHISVEYDENGNEYAVPARHTILLVALPEANGVALYPIGRFIPLESFDGYITPEGATFQAWDEQAKQYLDTLSDLKDSFPVQSESDSSEPEDV